MWKTAHLKCYDKPKPKHKEKTVKDWRPADAQCTRVCVCDQSVMPYPMVGTEGEPEEMVANALRASRSIVPYKREDKKARKKGDRSARGLQNPNRPTPKITNQAEWLIQQLHAKEWVPQERMSCQFPECKAPLYDGMLMCLGCGRYISYSGATLSVPKSEKNRTDGPRLATVGTTSPVSCWPFACRGDCLRLGSR